ncbi:MAG: DUF4430 domain-containing protein [Clostridia bacterium]|nr:DUF4430 domain-containing protein [Clostridia bacterium]
MKKIKILISVLLIVLTLSGCSNVEKEITTTYESQSTYSYEASSEESTLSVTEPQTTATEAVTTNIDEASATTTATTETRETTQIVTTTEASTSATTTATTEIRETTQIITTTEALTSVVTTTEPTTKKSDICTVAILCGTINNSKDKLKSSKEAFVPSDGIILKDVSVEVKNGETVFDVIKRACSENVCKNNCKYCQKSGIQIEYTYTPAFDNYYIEGIHQIYEKDCGTQSGWMYSVNGVFPNEGASSYNVKAGDKIVFAYTCDMGEDIGNSY